ncbi:metalloregulator ArsR/SmtB family transcription factor [Saccharibacillus alkalitolerans]|uniref:Metalloregulator ArsR/SmtB family transcription factor n=1 Tax=Saccharibacillus alkalitolerans TaxID=2705290 RepID=A0ABX0F699_9BACL|nr:metalloregulator ArsR/SmtB family transcription factor [Saccharibacillus alkalitolerans]NGZ76471.1 metalloregulator ArsR/SmtB family transcription factor [Saccharibacillus alkalitolerans]
MNEREFRDGVFGEFARIGKCLSSPKRLEILDILSQSPKSVEALSKSTAMSVANVSQHLQTLSQAKLVVSRRQGNFIFYELADPSVLRFLNSLYGLSENRLIEVKDIRDRFMDQFEDAEEVTLEELAKRMESGEVTLIDVRPADEYEAAHIPGAVSVPIGELAEKLEALPADSKIVAYCRGPYCLMSVKAAALLRERGFRAGHLDKNVHDWNEFRLGAARQS